MDADRDVDLGVVHANSMRMGKQVVMLPSDNTRLAPFRCTR